MTNHPDFIRWHREHEFRQPAPEPNMKLGIFVTLALIALTLAVASTL